MMDNPDLVYRQAEALSSDPAQLVVLLYNMLIKDLCEAVASISSGEIERRTTAVRHGLLVLQELQLNVDREHGGAVATNLDRFYDFIRAKLLEAQMKASSAILQELIAFVSSIRDAWVEVGKNQQKSSESEPAEEWTMPARPLEHTSGTAQWTA